MCPCLCQPSHWGIDLLGPLWTVVGSEGKARGWARLGWEVEGDGASLAECPFLEGCLPELFLALTH